MIRLIVVLTLAGSAGWAQVEAPFLGFVPESGRIRPIYGIPAAATVSPALDYGSDFTRLAVSPAQNYVLGSRSGSGAVVLIPAGGIPGSIEGAGANPDELVLSPRGSAAVLWFAAAQRAQVISGLPGAPAVRDVDLSGLRSGSDEAPSTLAVSDDGQWIAAVMPDAAYNFGPAGEVRRIPVRERASALAFSPGTHDLALVSRSHAFSIRDVGGAGTVSTLYEGALDAAGAAFSADNQHLVVADRSGSLLDLDLAAGSATRFACGCAPDGVFAMGRALFRITSFNGATFKLFDAATGDVFFVAAAGDAQ